MRRYDTVVVGAGPGGAVTALCLARAGARVGLIDKRSFPREKACGDLVGPRGTRLLADLDITPPGTRRVGDMIVIAPNGSRALLPALPGIDYPGHALAINRRHLDAALVDAAVAAGADFIHDRVVGLDGNQVRVAGGEPLSADMIVGADGAISHVAEAAGLVDQRRVLWGFALRGYLDVPVELPYIVLWEPQPWQLFPGYGWVFPTAEGGMNVGLGLAVGADRGGSRRASEQFGAFLDHLADVCVLPQHSTGRERSTDRDGRAGRDGVAGRDSGAGRAGGADRDPVAPRERGGGRDRFGGPDGVGERLGGWLKMGAVGTTPARGNVLLVGDAAGLINPLQGEGIAQAMASGRAAAEAIIAGPAGAAARYRAELSAMTAHHRVNAPVQYGMIAHPVAVSVAARLLTAPLVRSAVAGAWSLYWNDLVAGAVPSRHRTLADYVGRGVALATVRGAHTSEVRPAPSAVVPSAVVPSGEALSGEASSGEVSSGEASAGDAPTGEVSAGPAPSEV